MVAGIGVYARFQDTARAGNGREGHPRIPHRARPAPRLSTPHQALGWGCGHKDGSLMKPATLQKRIEGVLSPVITPFRKDYSADPDRFVRHCKWLLGHGCAGLAVFG